VHLRYAFWFHSFISSRLGPLPRGVVDSFLTLRVTWRLAGAGFTCVHVTKHHSLSSHLLPCSSATRVYSQLPQVVQLDTLLSPTRKINSICAPWLVLKYMQSPQVST
jgi:hypothetical protein